MSKPPYTPTPAQIVAACRRIRESWTPDEENLRLAVKGTVAWQIPGIEYADRIDRDTEKEFHE